MLKRSHVLLLILIILFLSFQSSSHPHGKRSNVFAGSLAIVAILLSVCQSILFSGCGMNYMYLAPSMRQLTAAWSFCVVAACVGTLAMVVTFTATCRAYPQCGLKAICGLYVLCLVCQLISLILAVTDNNLYSCRAAILGFSIPCLFLWGVCSICAALVPPYNINNEARVSLAAAVVCRSNAAEVNDEEEAK